VRNLFSFLASYHAADPSTDKPCPGRRYLVLFADTWLHIVTSTVIFTEVSESALKTSSFGRGLYSDECGNPYPCSVTLGTGSFLVGAAEAYRTLVNVSTTNSVSTFHQDGETYALLTDAQIPQDTDFKASTFAISTSCELLSNKCGLHSDSGASTPFDCSPSFYGDLTEVSSTCELGNLQIPSTSLSFFRDPDLTPKLYWISHSP
jgi:hypothetical protein